MKLSIIKKLIVIMVILIIITIIGIVIYKNNMDEYMVKEDVEEFDSGFQYEANNNGFKEIDDNNIFFSVADTINTYLEILQFDIDSKEYVGHYEIENEEDLKNLVLDLLDKNYINENNINSNNFYNYISLMDYAYKVIPKGLRVRYDSDNITTYIINIYIEDLRMNQLDERYYIVRTDSNNSTFSIEPVTNSVASIDDIEVEISNLNIEDKLYNRFSIKKISIEEMAKMYMSNFISLMVNYPETTYDDYLDTEYKEKRFGSLDDFKKYVNDNKEELSRIEAQKYLLNYEDSGKKYVIMDQYDNTYEFYETSTMNYKARLDTYTIISDNFKSTYDSANEQYKVAMNIDKWIQMLNSRDYINAYYLLDETFRNNNWGSEEVFEAYIKEKLPLHYNMEYGTYSEENSTYIQEIRLSDVTSETEDIVSLNIIMQLKDNYEFVMSFSFNE